jgi:hypothetical protein
VAFPDAYAMMAVEPASNASLPPFYLEFVATESTVIFGVAPPASPTAQPRPPQTPFLSHPIASSGPSCVIGISVCIAIVAIGGWCWARCRARRLARRVELRDVDDAVPPIADVPNLYFQMNGPGPAAHVGQVPPGAIAYPFVPGQAVYALAPGESGHAVYWGTPLP